MFDLLAGAGRDWALITGESEPKALIETVIVTADGEPFRAANGVLIEPGASLHSVGHVDVAVISDLFVLPQEDLSGRFESEAAWLANLYTGGATLAAACTGALLLAESGVLDDCDVTTHWAYCESMATRYPRVRVQPQRALITSGEGQRLIMAGGGTSWHDLALFLVARFISVEEAMRLARLHLLDWHHVGQQPFASLTMQRQVADALIAKCQEWIAEHYDADAPVSAKSASENADWFEGDTAFAAAVRSLLAVMLVYTLRTAGSGRFCAAPPSFTSLPSMPAVQ